MNKHRFNIFPEMQPEDYMRLKTDISQNGYDQKQPIYIYQGAILDGWNRFRACTDLTVAPVYKEFLGTDIDAINYVMRTNKRRNLTSSQWAAVAVEADEIVKAIKSETERQRREKQAETQSVTKSNEGLKDNLLSDSTAMDEHATKAATKLATTFNTNRTYINEAARLKEEKPEIFEQVKSGEKTLTQVKKEERIEEIKKQKQDIDSGKITELTGKYSVISIDPPWPYGREYDPETSRAASPYPEMSVEEIKSIELPDENDAVLFLWTTHAFLPDAFEIMKHWGYTYKATMVWDKAKMGMGAWFRMQCEFCLLGIKGKPYWYNTTERDIITEARREHSRKPDSFFNMVTKVTAGKRLEYFSREPRDGWDIFGNDTNKF